MNERTDRGDHDCNGDAAAYVLGALDAREVTPFLHHLDCCAICRDEVASLQVVADMLPAAVSPVSAPRALRRRVMATVYEEAELFRAARATPGQSARAKRRWRPVSRPFQGLAVASLVAAGIGVGLVTLNRPAPSGNRLAPSGNRVISASTTLPATAATLYVTSGHTQLDVANLPAAPNGRVYEVWLARRGEPTPTDALFTPTSDGRATVAVPGNLHDVNAVLVTDEPAGGSSKPTRTPVITASLS